MVGARGPRVHRPAGALQEDWAVPDAGLQYGRRGRGDDRQGHEEVAGERREPRGDRGADHDVGRRDRGAGPRARLASETDVGLLPAQDAAEPGYALREGRSERARRRALVESTTMRLAH